MHVFRAVGGFVFTRDSGERDVRFVPSSREILSPTLARIEIVNRSLMHPDGSGPVRQLDFDAFKLAWQPCAFLIALVVATPLPWSRRLRALGWGLLVVHGVIVLCLAFVIWRESAEVELVSLSPFWSDLAARWQVGFLTLLSLTCPVVIWVLVMFRSGDFASMRSRS